jgi:hypothetical protein
MPTLPCRRFGMRNTMPMPTLRPGFPPHGLRAWRMPYQRLCEPYKAHRHTDTAMCVCLRAVQGSTSRSPSAVQALRAALAYTAIGPRCTSPQGERESAGDGPALSLSPMLFSAPVMELRSTWNPSCPAVSVEERGRVEREVEERAVEEREEEGEQSRRKSRRGERGGGRAVDRCRAAVLPSVSVINAGCRSASISCCTRRGEAVQPIIYVCMYVCMYVCIYTYVCMYMNIYMCICSPRHTPLPLLETRRAIRVRDQYWLRVASARRRWRQLAAPPQTAADRRQTGS